MSGRTAQPTVGRRLRLSERAWAGVILVGLIALIPFVGPLPVLALFPAAAAMVLLIRYPVVAVLVPLLAAPVAFTTLPGTGGLRVIHLAVAVAVGGVVLGVLTGQLRTRPPLVLMWGGLFAAAYVVATMGSTDPTASIRNLLNHLLGLALAVCTGIVVRQDRGNLMWMMRGWVSVALVVIIPALPSALTAQDLFGGALIEGRAQGVFSQPNDYGEFSLYALVMSWALFVGSRHRTDRWLAGIGGVVGIAGVAVSFSRGTWVGLVVMIVTAVLLAPRLFAPVAILMGAVTPFVAIAIVTGTPPFGAIGGRLAATFSDTPNPEDARDLIHAEAIRIFLQNPLAGRGPGTFPQTAYDPGSPLFRNPVAHGHTVPYTVAAELGMLGLVALLAVAIAMGLVYLRTRYWLVTNGEVRDNQMLAILAAGLVGIAFHGLADNVFTNPYLIPLAWAQLGILAGACAGVRSEWRRHRRRPPPEGARTSAEQPLDQVPA